MTYRSAKPRAVAASQTQTRFRQTALAFGFGVLAAAAWVSAVRADELIVTHGVSTFGDLKYGPDFEHLDYVNPDAPKGGEMSFAWSSGSFDSMHPYTRKGRSGILSNTFFESMLDGTADEIGSAYGLLAETISYPEDKSYVIFKIREGAKFSDGTPVTAEDAVFSYEILRDEGLPSFRASIGKTLASAEVIDARTVRFDFNPEAPLRGRIQSAGGLPVFSKASHEASGLAFEESRLTPLIGSGPYVLDELDVGNRIVYARNPDYWAQDLPLMRGRNNYDKIRIEYFGDSIAAFEGFTSGTYTFRQESSSVTWANSYDFPALEAGHVIKAELPKNVITSGQSFVLNTRLDKFQDVRVREAMDLMFNFEWTNKTLFFGLYEQGPSFWQNTELAAEGLPSEAELAILEPLRDQLRPEVFDQPVYAQTPSNPDSARDRRKARKALKLLQEAGWTPGDDGLLRNADGQTLEVEFLNSSPLFDRIINPYVENLRSIGVDARLTRVDNAQLNQREDEYDFDVITDHIPMGYEPGSGLRQYFGLESSNNSAFNKAGVGSEAIDVLIETVIKAETKPEMITATKALDRVLRWERIRVPQWYNGNHWVAYYDMYEHPEELPPYALGFADFWWINADKQAALKAEGAL